MPASQFYTLSKTLYDLQMLHKYRKLSPKTVPAREDALRGFEPEHLRSSFWHGRRMLTKQLNPEKKVLDEQKNIVSNTI